MGCRLVNITMTQAQRATYSVAADDAILMRGRLPGGLYDCGSAMVTPLLSGLSN
jgi:hypothetical protein